jgi:hypothetical protein
MKFIFLTVTFGIMLSSTCRQQKQNTISPTFNADSVAAIKTDTISHSALVAPVTSSKTKGNVSHEYARNGCPVIIIVHMANDESPLVLIPRTPLSEEFDKEGMEINFNYHPLKMPQPEGCAKGIPAEITDVSLK